MKIVADIDLPFVRAYFGNEGELVLKPGRLIEGADLIDADLLLVRSLTRVNEQLLKGSSVKFVGTVTTGIDHLDTAWLEENGILWCSAAGYNARPVADYVIAVLASLQQQNKLSTSSLRIGIVGLGRVGSQVAERCKRLGHELLFCDPPRAEKEKNFPSFSLSEFRKLDLLTLHVPLSYSGNYPTYHLIDERFLQAAAKNSILVNTSRGAVVDTAALKSGGENLGLCFDVWEGEPQIELNVLQRSLIATPHLAGYSVQSRYRGIDLVYRAFHELNRTKSNTKMLPPLPRNHLSFGNRRLSWREVVLAVFDPSLVTQKMKATLLKGPRKCATLFDELRHTYIGDQVSRHEFAYTTISQADLREEDRYMLTQLGMTIT